jgi:predicted DNA-binding protein (MmcQ/YjbR family)
MIKDAIAADPTNRIEIVANDYTREIGSEMSHSALNSLVYAINKRMGFVVSKVDQNGQVSKSAKTTKSGKKGQQLSPVSVVFHPNRIEFVLKSDEPRISANYYLNCQKWVVDVMTISAYSDKLGRINSDLRKSIIEADELDQNYQVLKPGYHVADHPEIGSELSDYGAACQEVAMTIITTKNVALLPLIPDLIAEKPDTLCPNSKSVKWDVISQNFPAAA